MSACSGRMGVGYKRDSRVVGFSSSILRSNLPPLVEGLIEASSIPVEPASFFSESDMFRRREDNKLEVEKRTLGGRERW